MKGGCDLETARFGAVPDIEPEGVGGPPAELLDDTWPRSGCRLAVKALPSLSGGLLRWLGFVVGETQYTRVSTLNWLLSRLPIEVPYRRRQLGLGHPSLAHAPSSVYDNIDPDRTGNRRHQSTRSSAPCVPVGRPPALPQPRTRVRPRLRDRLRAVVSSDIASAASAALRLHKGTAGPPQTLFTRPPNSARVLSELRRRSCGRFTVCRR